MGNSNEEIRFGPHVPRLNYGAFLTIAKDFAAVGRDLLTLLIERNPPIDRGDCRWICQLYAVFSLEKIGKISSWRQQCCDGSLDCFQVFLSSQACGKIVEIGKNSTKIFAQY
jgi:hypothetical protein